VTELSYGAMAVNRNKKIEELEAEIIRLKAERDEYIQMAISSGEKTYGNTEFYVRYANGKKKVPSVELLETLYPDKYNAIRNRQIEQYKVKLTKADLDIEFDGIPKADKEAIISTVMIEFDQPPQYLMRTIGKEGSQ